MADQKDVVLPDIVPGGTRTRNLCLRRAAPYPLGHRDVTTDTARKKCCREVLPGLEPGLQGSEPWVLTNYTIEPSSLRRTQGDGPRNCDGSLERKTTKVEEGMQYPTHKRIAACSALHTSALGWCSWLSRVPHTHKVTSSILVPSTFVFWRSGATSGLLALCGRCLLQKTLALSFSQHEAECIKASRVQKSIRAENRTRDLQCVRLT